MDDVVVLLTVNCCDGANCNCIVPLAVDNAKTVPLYPVEIVKVVNDGTDWIKYTVVYDDTPPKAVPRK